MSIFSRFKKGRDDDDAAAPPTKSPVPPPLPPSPVARNSNGRSKDPVAPPPRSNAAADKAAAVERRPVAPGGASVAADRPPALSRTMAYNAPAAAVARARQEYAEIDIVPPPPVHEPIQDAATGSIDLAIQLTLESAPPPAVAHGTSTASDHAALHSTFEDLAVPHMAEVRSVMMEVRWGDVQSSWLELARPALRSLRKMAEPVGHGPLVQALDGFLAEIDRLLAAGQPPALPQPARDAVWAAYEPLIACLPRAFELEGERDRREPLIVQALLEQVQGLEPLMIEKMMAAGLGRLSALYAARADEIAAVTGIPDTIAAATATSVQAFRRATPAGLATVDPAETLRDLGKLLEALRSLQTAFEEAARGWSEKDWQAKKQVRRQRQQAFSQITIELVRLGEVDLAQRMPKLAFARRIDELDRLIGQAAVSARTNKKAS